jgi:tetratricopeptide (TPR) repeat protein
MSRNMSIREKINLTLPVFALLAASVLALMVAPMPASAQQRPSDADRLAFAQFEAAILSVHIHDLEAAARSAQALQKSHPRSGYAQIIDAEIDSTYTLSETGEPREVYGRVMKLANEAIRMQPRLAQAYATRARAQVKSGQLDIAMQDIRMALSISPDNSSAHFVRATIHEARGKSLEAIRDYERFIELVPDPRRQANAHHAIGKMYEQAAYTYCVPPQNYVSATRSSYEASATKQPEQQWRRMKLAMSLVGLVRDYPAGESIARAILSNDPSSSEARTVLAAAY